MRERGIEIMWLRWINCSIFKYENENSARALKKWNLKWSNMLYTQKGLFHPRVYKPSRSNQK